MSKDKVLEAHHQSFTADESGSLPGGRPMPGDFLEEASRRLEVAAMIWAGISALLLVVNNLVTPHLNLPSESVIAWPPPANIIAPLVVVVSIGLIILSKKRLVPPARLLDLGLGYQVMLAFAIGLVNQWEPRVLAGRLSWLCALILVFPVLIPASPRKTFVTALISASMDPVGLAIARARHLELPPLTVLFWAYLPNYICAVLAVLPAQIITRLGRQVSKARELGSYRLEERLGQGGMGEIWRARHRLLVRPAAVKLIRPEMLESTRGESSELLTRRFEREAQAAANLQSPHTINLYDFGVARDGTFYYVMELLNGLDLDDLVRRFGPVSPARAVHLLRQACHSLADAHAHGLIHRDIKPSNLYACRLGEDVDFVKVLDFGLVKSDPSYSRQETLLTAPDTTTGTPAFMAPEMILNQDVDRRADIYALGCVGYWLLTGRLVFEADTAFRMMVMHLQEPPIPVSQRTDVVVPADLERVVMACLAKGPAERPAEARELDRLLAACDVGRWSEDDASRWWGEHMAH